MDIDRAGDLISWDSPVAHLLNCTDPWSTLLAGTPVGVHAPAPMKNGHFAAPPPAQLHTLTNFGSQLSSGLTSAGHHDAPSTLQTHRLATAASPYQSAHLHQQDHVGIQHRKATSDLIDLDLDSLRGDGDVLDLFDPLKVNSPSPSSRHSPPVAGSGQPFGPPSTDRQDPISDQQQQQQQQAGQQTIVPANEHNRQLPKASRPVPAERESLRKRESVTVVQQQQQHPSQTSGDASTPAVTTALHNENDISCVRENEITQRASPSSEASSPGSVSEVLAKRSEERLRFLEGFRVEQRQRSANPDDEVFWSKCKQLRSEFTHDDHLTNPGLIVSPTLDTRWQEPMSVRMEISTPACERPFCFTCDVSTTIQHVISQVVYSAGLDDINMDNYALRVRGRAEYLTSDSMVREYEYAHWCVKFDRPLYLTLVKIEELRRPWQRVLRDDAHFLDVKSCDLLPADSHNVELLEIRVYLDTFRQEASRILRQSSGVVRASGVVQVVKAVCARLSRVETNDLVQALEGLERLCEADAPDLIEMERRREVVSYQLLQIQRNLHQLLDLYSETFPVDFVVCNDQMTPPTSPGKRSRKEVTLYSDSVLFQAGSLYQPRPEWLVNHDRFILCCNLVYGWRIIHQVESQNGRVGQGLFKKIDFEDWLELAVPMRLLPRESALYVKLFGLNKEDPSQRVALGWFALNLFSSKRELVQGIKLCPLWGADVDEMSGPPCCSDSPSAPLMLMQFTEFDNIVFFPKVCHEKVPKVEVDLDPEEEQRLREMLDCDPLCSLLTSEVDKKFFWDRRLFVRKLPQLLPKVLLSRDTWCWIYLKDIYATLREWKPASYISALTLLLPQFPDSEVRRVAVSWIKYVGSDELCDHLPQLVQALRFEAWEDSPVTWFLLERALTSTRVAHQMYWLLRQNEANVLSRRRVRLMMSALRIISGGAFSGLITAQDKLLRGLRTSADALKRTRENDRISCLMNSMRVINDELEQNGPLCLPLNPCLEVAGIDVKNCSYFTSNTLPLKVTFKNIEPLAESHEVIFKVGDDLRQDMLVLQMIRIMDKLWLKQGLDLRIITFECVATGKDEGMVEVVREAETLRKIQTEHGLTGSFKDKPIAEWLKKHNGSEAEYERAVENFSLSCAGYCVATYVLGICDRHNDNIMLRPSGHMFHIDFGKFLGDSQMFGSIKRDRVPFVLTSDMVYVINGGDKPSKKFQIFVEKCCEAFNILRASSNVLITLFGLMVSSGIPGLNEDAVQFVQKALMLGKSHAEASVAFTQLVREASSSMSTQMNFFIHNIAQMRFTGDHNDTLTLNFAPKIHTKKTDGRLLYYQIIGCQKKHIPEKHYVYVIRLRRDKESVDTKVHRTYDEFLEFHYKLSKLFPNAPFPPLTKSSLIGRTNTADVAEKRKTELVNFLRELQNMAEEVAHCDLVYTFFHPLYRDHDGLKEEHRLTNELQMAGPSGHYEPGSAGRIKLDLTFANQRLSIMVMHAENLRCERKTAPDAYVKTYLKPDPDKQTKRKTRIVSRCKHPTFMELVSYRYPYETLRTLVLEVSVWDHDRVQGNEMLGSAYIVLDKLDLRKPHIAWFNLLAVGRGFAS
ncbi:phosphatidylinositol 4-phosphate 3-kinase C2 domain-containing subunit alpha-like isoform X2 [Varroa jacobsoni]|uniref:phosphatidylinositol 4-phosphate 3-kinase C2 domain-containing subunit alpha-like isoform X2 n=1 Tax=Varroa jacobsoni TaxID=62625 RepID=UPI000BF2ED90|nr:phosphatidylinositol 4-phosphate 3-kinase C2 domain-containing subunit alpha-like isoform X2 [Varroa jacobsoni]